MVPRVLHLIKEAFWITPWIAIPCILIGFTVIIFMVTITIIFVLDSSDRNISKRPYNFFLDRIIPLTAIFSPTVIISILNPLNVSWMEKFAYILLSHFLIIIPLMHFWSRHRFWTDKSNDLSNNYVEWNEPILYKVLTIALVYPTLWGFYFSLCRYFRLGHEIAIIDLLSYINLDYRIIFVCLIPYLFLWILLFLEQLNVFRYWAWFNYISIIKLIHLYLLRFYLYFYICENVYKVSFILGRYITLVDDVYPKTRNYTWFRYTLQTLYMKPWIFTILTLSITLIELLFTFGKVKYSLYLIFILPILYAISYFFYSWYTTDFLQDVCNADYYAKNWLNPKYPVAFWHNFNYNEYRHGFHWDFTQEEMNQLQQLADVYLKKKYHTPFTLPRKVQHHPYCFRLKAAYKVSSGVRWVHTSIEKPLHSATGYFVRSILERLVLIHNNWKPHYHIIQRTEKTSPGIDDTPEKWYNNFDNPRSKSIRTILEQNFNTNFVPLIKKGVIVSEYNSEIVINTKPKTNTEPDAILNMSESTFNDKRIHAIDQKTKKGLTSVVYSNVTNEFYKEKLRKFFNALTSHHPNIDKSIIYDILEKLARSSQNFTIHQMVWATNLNHFPSNFIPPMRLPKHFSLADTRLEFRILFEKKIIMVHKLSDFLYAKGIPEISITDPLPEKALVLFTDSELQRILGS